MRNGPGTPGFGGYVAAFAIGFAVFALLSSVAGTDRQGISAFDTVLVFAFFGVYLLGVPVVVGVVVVPAIAACRLCRTQRIQVAAAAGTALPFAYLLSMITVGRAEQLVVVLGLPLAMAIGRACVIPVAVERGLR